jgi:peptide alpha-N-acetyltransferase
MIAYREYQGGDEIYIMKSMIDKELSEPYTIYTYRYFFKEFPELTFTVVLLI